MGKSAFSRQVPRTWDHFCPQPQLAARVEVLHCWHLTYRKVPMNAYTLWWTNIAMENGHRNSGFSHEKWWFSIAMLVHQRVNVWYAYHLSWDVGVETRSVLPFLAASSILAMEGASRSAGEFVVPRANLGKVSGRTSGSMEWPVGCRIATPWSQPSNRFGPLENE